MQIGGYQAEEILDKHWRFSDVADKLLRFASKSGAGANKADLRPWTSPRHNQRNTNSCVGQSVVKAFEIKRNMIHGVEAHEDLSVLAVYYLARELMTPQRTDKDQGTYISLAMDAVRRYGVCLEEDWPFIPNKVLKPPPFLAMRRAYMRRIKAFYRITEDGSDRVEAIQTALRAGSPVVYGTSVGDAWLNYEAGQVLRPESQTNGGHATVLVGFDGDVFIGENSWGRSWGDDGFYLAHEDLIKDSRSRDFWICTEGGEAWTDIGD